VPDPADGYARSRERAEATRAALRPLGPDERPLGLKLAVALAVVIALANFVIVAAEGGRDAPGGIAFATIMLLAAGGMWQRRYLALIAFEGLLAVSIVYAALSLAFVSNLRAVLLAALIIVVCTPIFWLLIRVMARLRVPGA
jgi:hypothetical protein